MELNRIVCATDFSPDAAHGLRRAMRLAAENDAALRVVHVVPRESLDALREWVRTPVDFAERLVDSLREEIQAWARASAGSDGVRIETSVVVADVVEALLAEAASSDLLVLGAHGLNPLKDLILGTTAERMAASAKAPILVVRTAPAGPYAKVLVAVDLLPGSEEPMAAALRFVGEGTVVAAHAYDLPMESMLQRAGVPQAVLDGHRAQAHREAMEKIAALGASVSGDPSRFLAFAERGHPAATIVDRQRAMGADLVVVRKRARSLAETLVLGSVARHVLADVAADVLLLGPSRQ